MGAGEVLAESKAIWQDARDCKITGRWYLARRLGIFELHQIQFDCDKSVELREEKILSHSSDTEQDRNACV
jgi:hypothetical protein